MSGQMLAYNTKDGLLPGDENFRVSTQQHKKRRTKRERSGLKYHDEGVTVKNYKVAKYDDVNRRLCGDLDQFSEHSNSMTRGTNKSACQVCGKPTLWKYRKCDGKYMCVLENKKFEGASCLIRYHMTHILVWLSVMKFEWQEMEGCKSECCEEAWSVYERFNYYKFLFFCPP